MIPGVLSALGKCLRHFHEQVADRQMLRTGFLTFSAPDTDKFPCLAIAFNAIKRGGSLPCVMNAANEVANLAFRNKHTSFTSIGEIIAETIGTMPFTANPTVENLLDIDREARAKATEIINKKH